MRIDGKVVMLTGAGRGIGRSIALRLAADGADLALLDIDASALDSIADEVRALGRRALPIVADVSQRQQIFDAIDSAERQLNSFDVMINNAGIVQVQPISAITEEEVDAVVSVNIKGVLWGIQAAAAKFIERGHGGKIINASSIAGHDGYAMFGAYSASKFAVRALTQSAAQEFGPHGITVNAYCPGNVGTEMLEKIDRRFAELDLAAPGETLKILHAKSSLNRPETAEDVSAFVSFLACSDSDYINGQAILVDGGGVFR